MQKTNRCSLGPSDSANISNNYFFFEYKNYSANITTTVMNIKNPHKITLKEQRRLELTTCFTVAPRKG
jgi:hypothetical protein